MSRKSLSIVVLIIILLCAGCATTPKYTPFKVSKGEIYTKTKTIALMPLIVPAGMTDPDPVKVTFESLIEARLREAGFLIVPSGEFAEIFKRMTEQVGGYFDPVTGKLDEVKYNTVQKHTYEELRTKWDADALFIPSIQIFKVNWRIGRSPFPSKVSWHGTSESISSYAAVLLDSIIGIRRSGTVPALSLTVCIQDLNGVDQYSHYGGIQLMAKLSGDKFSPVPREKLFTDEERNTKAVDIALGPLLEKTESTKDTKKKEK